MEEPTTATGAVEPREGAGPADSRPRLTRWAEEGLQLLRTVPGILAENDRLRARAEAAEQECERLRQEISEVGETLRRVVNETLQPLSETVQRLRVPQRRGGLAEG
jgi:uncharacterized coiled-coil DUF342 family protein